MADLTHQELAEIAQLHPVTIRRVLAGTHTPSMRSAHKIADALTSVLSATQGLVVNPWDLWPAEFKRPPAAKQVQP